MKTSAAIAFGLLFGLYSTTSTAQTYAMGSLSAYTGYTAALATHAPVPHPVAAPATKAKPDIGPMKQSLDLLPDMSRTLLNEPALQVQEPNGEVQSKNMADELESWFVTEQALRKTYSRRKLSIF